LPCLSDAEFLYVEARYGVAWSNVLLDEFGTGRWCLTLDADEQFVYPGCETSGLRRPAQFLVDEGARGVFAFHLDMYGGAAVADAVYRPGTPFVDTCPFLDPDYRWVDRRGIPPMDLLGGPRLRCFHPEFLAPGFVHTQIRRCRRLGARVLGRPIFRAIHLPRIPLIRWAPGTRYLTSHEPNELELSAVTGALLHFKFFADFHQRVGRGGEPPTRDADTRNLGNGHGALPPASGGQSDVSLSDASTVRYESTAQLVSLGLLKDVAGWLHVRSAAARPDRTQQEALPSGSRHMTPTTVERRAG
jgi:hypothetical protein